MSARHPYNFCEDDDTLCTVTCLSIPLSQGPWAMAKALAACSTPLHTINATLKMTVDKKFLEAVKSGYTEDAWCQTLPSAVLSLSNLVLHDVLWYIGDRLIILQTGNIWEMLFSPAHDILSHFSFHKTYGSLRNLYYWPNMHWDLEQGYVASCPECQCNKSLTTKLYGLLHPLLVPDQCGDSVAINFIGPLPEDDGKNCILTFTDCLGSDIQLIPTRTDITTEQVCWHLLR